MTKELNEEKEVKVHIDDLHFEHQSWVRELAFYRDEMNFYTARLEEVASRYTSQEVMKEVEHFQNELYIQKNAVDELVHDVNEHEHFLATFSQENPIAVDRVLFDDHGPLRDRVETNREIVHDFKKAYQRFLAKWM